jgi:hypothetical protein
VKTIAPLGAYAVSLVALVLVIITGHDPALIVSLVAPVMASLYVSNKVDQVHTTARQVQHQTNGALDARIKNAVHEAINKTGGKPAP